MTLLMRDQEHERIGQKIGEERMLALIKRLLEDNRFSDIAKVAEDKQYRQHFYKEYHLI